MSTRKKILLIAFHFPPFGSGSGVHRAAKFSEYLPDNGWQPYVLTANTRAYESRSEMAVSIATGISVHRAFALDAQRHLSFRGRYLQCLALPDRWSSWVLGAVPHAVFAVFAGKIDVVFATFPISTAVLIGLLVHYITRKPLVIDFRDSMTEEGYPRDPRTRRLHRWIESLAVRHSSLVVFTTESTRRMYLDRYPDLVPAKCVVIANGYDEQDFAHLTVASTGLRSAGCPVRLVHAGVMYTDDRDPRCFFKALSRLRAEGVIEPHNVKIDLRASGSEEYYSNLLQELGIQDLVHLLPALSHERALEDLATADGLLLFQAASCNHQIPAKVYEYFRFGKPVLALTSARGDTAALLKEVGGATIVELDDENAIYRSIPAFLRSLQEGTHPLPDPEKMKKYTRRSGTAQLARQLDKLFVPGIRQQELASVKD